MSQDESTEQTSGQLLATLRGALNAGLLAGFLLGIADGVVAGVRTGTSGFVNWLGCLAGSVVVYGAVALAGLFLLSPLMHRLLRGRDLMERLRAQLALALGLGIFGDLYWWTRPYILWGVPATDWRRIAVGLVLLLIGLGIGVAAAKLAPRIPLQVKWVAALLVPLSYLGGIFYLNTAGNDVAERGRINERNRDMPNVLLFVVDALRDDVLGCYGNERVQTPVIDDLAAKGVVFENTFVQAPFTWSSFGSILTGKYPRRHGLLKMAPGVFMPQNITLASHLKSARKLDGKQLLDGDYASATFMTGTLSHGSGLLHGFDAYFEAMVGHPFVEIDNPWSVFKSELVLSRLRAKLAQRFDEAPVAGEAVKWFRDNGQKRFVAMVHYYSTHTPYDPPERFRKMYVDAAYDGPIHSFYAGAREAIERGDYTPTQADREQIANLYYAGVTQADDMIGQVLLELERQRVLSNTLVIVTSDHGEELGEHDLWEHNFMYQTNLRIPLVMTLPGGLPAATRVEGIAETVDILPTVCELARIEVPTDPALDATHPGAGQVDGVSLMPMVRGEAESVKRFSFAENGQYLSVQDTDWKLIIPEEGLGAEGWAAVVAGELPGGRLYDLAGDPGERKNLLGERPDEAQFLIGVLREWDAEMPRGREVILRSHRDIDDKELEGLLNELGYADGVGVGEDD